MAPTASRAYPTQDGISRLVSDRVQNKTEFLNRQMQEMEKTMTEIKARIARQERQIRNWNTALTVALLTVVLIGVAALLTVAL